MDIWRLPLEARRELWNAVGYVPSKEQEIAHIDPHRLKLVSGGERAGKSFWTAHELATWLVLTGDKDIIWLTAIDYDLARPEFSHLLEQYGKVGLVNTSTAQMPTNGSWTMWTKRGTQITTKTTVDVKKLAGVAPAGIVMCEAAQQGYESFIRCRGRVSQKRGPLVMSGTQEGSRGWYADMYYEWETGKNAAGGMSFSMPTWSNLASFPGGRQDAEILSLEATLTPDAFNERLGGVPCPPTNLVLREFSVKTHATKPCPFDPKLPVQVWIDPGYAGAYAVLAVQSHGREFWVIDEVYKRAWVVHDVIDVCKEREWWKSVTHGVIDVSGRQHAGQESQIEVWLRYANVRLFSQQVPILAGIERYRTYLRDPASGEALFYIDPRCVNTIKEHGLYIYPKSKERYHETELPIQANNHAISAIIYGLVANVGLVERPALGEVSVTFRR